MYEYDQYPCTTYLIYSWAYTTCKAFYLHLLKAIARVYLFCLFLEEKKKVPCKNGLMMIVPNCKRYTLNKYFLGLLV